MCIHVRTSTCIYMYVQALVHTCMHRHLYIHVQLVLYINTYVRTYCSHCLLTLLSCLLRSSISELRMVLSWIKSELSFCTRPLNRRSSSALNSASFTFNLSVRISSCSNGTHKLFVERSHQAVEKAASLAWTSASTCCDHNTLVL